MQPQPALNRAARRRMAREERKQQKRGTAIHEPEQVRDPEFQSLATMTYELLTSQLETFGNKLSDAHRTALMRMVGTYAAIILGRETGRYQFPLDTGCGKTESVIALCTALHRLGMDYGVAVAASQVEALCDIKRRLVANGVPEEKVGLQHSYGGKASLKPTEENRSRQFYLVTHNRVRGRDELDDLKFYKGDRRRLLIWDESLLLANARTVSHAAYKAQLAALTSYADSGQSRGPDKVQLSTALGYLGECEGVLDYEQAAQVEEGFAPQALTMPSREASEITAYKQWVRHAGAAFKQQVSALGAFLDIAQTPLRVLPEAGGQIRYDLVIPPDIENIVVLDASWPLRLAVQAGEQFKEDAAFMRYAEGVKQYDNVSIHTLYHGSGRRALEKLFAGKSGGDRPVSKEVALVIREEVPEGEKVLIFTHMSREKDPNGPDIPFLLRKDLIDLGVDTNRVEIATWGNHTSTNEYADCPNIILLGILHPPELMVAGQMIGQQDDLTAPLHREDLTKALQGEVAHAAYQALSRGTCRSVVNGQAKPMKAWLLHYNQDALNLMKERLPGAVWLPWETKYILPIGEQKITRAAQAITDHLISLPRGAEKVSTKQLKQDLDMTEVAVSTWKLAVAEAADTVPGWLKEARSFVRYKATDYGFEPTM